MSLYSPTIEKINSLPPFQPGKPVRVGITGGAGFIASNLLQYLIHRKSHLGIREITVIDNFSTGKKENIPSGLGGIRLLEGDLADPLLCREFITHSDLIFHLAGRGSVPFSLEHPGRSFQDNVAATLGLLTALKESGRTIPLVYSASSSRYGNPPGTGVTLKSEKQLPAPLSPYAAFKLANEYLIQAWVKSFGLRACSIIYFNVFGPRQDPAGPYAAVIPIFINQILRGQPVRIHGDGSQSRDFTYVDNVVTANLSAMFGLLGHGPVPPESLSGESINVACGTYYSLNRLVACIEKLTGQTARVEFSPPRAGDVLFSCADQTQAQSRLGWKAFIEFEAGLEQTVNWFKKIL
jgi:nucleoside-diphosphate-sugar epimerase